MFCDTLTGCNMQGLLKLSSKTKEKSPIEAGCHMEQEGNQSRAIPPVRGSVYVYMISLREKPFWRNQKDKMSFRGDGRRQMFDKLLPAV